MQKKNHIDIGKQVLGCMFFFAIFLNVTHAQQNGTVSGRITNTTGTELAGASIKAVPGNKVAVTDKNGFYSLQLPAGTYSFEVSFVSYLKNTKTNVSIKAASATTLNFTLQDDKKELDEVVVTALNISREQKALGYAITTISNEQLMDALPNNWTEALSGKVAGLNLIRSNGGPAGSNSIILRGENNLTGNNSALIVVDGVIINGGSGRSTGGSGAYIDESVVDYGTSLNDINPEDIEKVTILKGPGAAALYGSRGANGAIIITTKSGKAKSKGIGVSLNSNITFETINRMPAIQYEYGQGVDGAGYFSYGASADGAATNRTTNAFGPKFNGQYYYQYDPATNAQGTERTLWRPYKDEGFNSFFETAKTYTNSVTIDGGTDKTTARFSYTNVYNEWIIPNTGYGRNTIAMSVNSKPSKDLHITSKINYTSRKSDNLPGGGYNNQTIMYGFIFWAPSAPVSWMRNYWVPGKENITQNTPLVTGPDNPYLIAHEMLNKQNRNSLTGNISATYSINKDWSIMLRTAMDLANEARSQQRPFDTERFRKGMFRTQDIVSREVNSDFLIRYKKKFNKDLDIDASFGGAVLQNYYNRNEVRADSLLFPGIFTFANSAGPLWTKPYRAEYAIHSLYGLVAAGYKNYAFLDFTLRNDWSSLLATPTSRENISIIYPSVNASLILSEIFNLPGKINYAKWRLSLSGVGSGGTTPYNTSVEYSSDPAYAGGLYNPTTLNNPNLKPLYTYSYETGVELKLFKSRVGLDLAVYTADSKNQILNSLLDPSTGVYSVVVNAGKVRNRGIEMTLSATPVKINKGLTWNVNTTFSANDNKILALAEGLTSLTLQRGPGSNGFLVAYIGGSMGDLYGRGYLRSPDGQIVYRDGNPVLTDDIIYLGNTMPKWKAGVQNQFKFKNFSLGFLFDGQYGSVAYSLTQGKMAVQGKSEATLPGRYNGIVGTGVMLNAEGKYVPNTVVAEDLSSYYDTHFGISNIEGSTFSTDFVKLREARFDYTFNKKSVQKLKLQGISVGVYGRDLLIMSRWPGFDPEFGTLSGGEINRGFEIGQFPSTRSFGVNLKVDF